MKAIITLHNEIETITALQDMYATLATHHLTHNGYDDIADVLERLQQAIEHRDHNETIKHCFDVAYDDLNEQFEHATTDTKKAVFKEGMHNLQRLHFFHYC